MHWWFTNLVASGFTENAYSVILNVTTPDAYSGGDMVYAAASIFDSLSNYDQEGIAVGSSWVGEQAPCTGGRDWCAYFSVCVPSSLNNYCGGPSAIGFTTYNYDLQPNTEYQEQMSVDSIYDGLIWLDELKMSISSVDLNTGGTTLLDSWTYTNYALEGFHFVLTQSYCDGASTCPLDFTDYEEVYALNSVEGWPAFNFHTAIQVSASVNCVPWQGTEQLGSGFPGYNSPLQMVMGCTGGRYAWNTVSIDNNPFDVWAGQPWGYGFDTQYVFNSKGSSFSVAESLNALADPRAGDSLEYQVDYCSNLPCSDFSYQPWITWVQSANFYWSPNGLMWVNGTVPTAGTYTISAYAVDLGYANLPTDISQWNIVFEY